MSSLSVAREKSTYIGSQELHDLCNDFTENLEFLCILPDVHRGSWNALTMISPFHTNPFDVVWMYLSWCTLSLSIKSDMW
jgi:hypothetical protein